MVCSVQRGLLRYLYPPKISVSTVGDVTSVTSGFFSLHPPPECSRVKRVVTPGGVVLRCSLAAVV